MPRQLLLFLRCGVPKWQVHATGRRDVLASEGRGGGCVVLCHEHTESGLGIPVCSRWPELHDELIGCVKRRALQRPTAYTETVQPLRWRRAQDRMPAVDVTRGHFCLYGVVQFLRDGCERAGALNSERCAARDCRILSSSLSAERGSARRSRPRQGTWTKSNV